MSLALELCCRKTSDPELTGSSGHSMQQVSGVSSGPRPAHMTCHYVIVIQN